MANEEHLAILRQGTAVWNEWREREPSVRPDLIKADLRGVNLIDAALRGADLRGADLRGVNLINAHLYEANLRGADLTVADLLDASLSKANLSRANLTEAHLLQADFTEARLSRANLSGANLSGANLYRANLTGAHLPEANLTAANLSRAKFTGANLSGARIEEASLVRTTLTNANLTGCRIYGISAWGLKLSEETRQQDLVITPSGEPEVTVDNIEVAQFIYLLLRNEKIRSVIDTITSKVVLVLGRFTSERKRVLDALRDELRQRNYLPVVFDFEKPANQTTHETITLLARMARFVIADISDAKSVLQELTGIVPDLPSVPVQPLLLRPQDEPGMFDFFRGYPWFLKIHHYDNLDRLVAELGERVIGPAEAKVVELRGVRP